MQVRRHHDKGWPAGRPKSILQLRNSHRDRFGGHHSSLSPLRTSARTASSGIPYRGRKSGSEFRLTNQLRQ